MADYTLSAKVEADASGFQKAMDGVKESLGGAEKKSSIFSANFAANLASNAVMGAISTVKGAIKDLIGAATGAGSELEQSLGGVDTLYEGAAGSIKGYAREAYKYGLSANDYMEQSTSFAAALKSALKGDVTAAAEAANTALEDMADNSAKLGTPIESLQNAYQGFAKQNYTMLDNLKLGYGGTKKEMERLLADAQEITGVEYDIDNLADVYNAIHVIQGELHLTGVAAAEAKTTFSGSLAAMESAATNLLGAAAIGDDIQDELAGLLTTAKTFLFDNALPMIGNVMSAIPGAIQQAFPEIRDSVLDILSGASEALLGYDIFSDLSSFGDGIIDFLGDMVPDFITRGLDWIIGLVDGFLDGAPEILSNVNFILDSIFTGLSEGKPKIFAKGAELIKHLASGIIENGPEILAGIAGIIGTILAYFGENIVYFLGVGADIVTSIAGAIMEHAPDVLASFGGILAGVFTFITERLPEFLAQGVALLTSIIDGITSAIPAFTETIGGVITGALSFFMEHAPEFLARGADIIANVIVGIADMIPAVIGTIGDVIAGIIGFIASHGVDFITRGIEIIVNIARGILDSLPHIIGTIGDVVGSVIAFLADNLPKFAQKGIEIIARVASGILENMPKAAGAIGTVIGKVLAVIAENLPKLLQKGIELIGQLIAGIITSIPKVGAALVDVVKKITDTIKQKLPEVVSKGKEILISLARGVVEAIPRLIAKIPEIFRSFKAGFSQFDWGSIGSNIIDGVKNGIANAGGRIVDAAVGAASSAYESAKSFLGIHSPSTLFRDGIGLNIGLGVAEGFEDAPIGARIADTLGGAFDYVTHTADSIASRFDIGGILSGSNQARNFGPAYAGNTTNVGGITNNIYGAQGQSEETLADLVAEKLMDRIRRADK